MSLDGMSAPIAPACVHGVGDVRDFRKEVRSEVRSEASVLGDRGRVSLAPVREQSGGRLRMLRAGIRAARGYGSAPVFALGMGGLSAPAVVQAMCALSKGCACVCSKRVCCSFLQVSGH
jgi:hypothetical protein